MTNVQKVKNEYGHYKLMCPFCPGFSYFREATKISPDETRDLKRHILNAAKNEAFAVATRKDITQAIAQPHLDYVIEHYDFRPINSGTMKKQFDNDLKIA